MELHRESCVDKLIFKVIWCLEKKALLKRTQSQTSVFYKWISDHLQKCSTQTPWSSLSWILSISKSQLSQPQK